MDVIMLLLFQALLLNYVLLLKPVSRHKMAVIR